MNVPDELRATYRLHRSMGARVYLLSALPACAILILSSQTNVPLSYLTRDALVIAHETGWLRPYYGFISNLEIALFLITLGAYLLTTLVLARLDSPPRLIALIALGAALNAALAFDDMFLIHESTPKVLRLIGMSPQLAAYGEYTVYLVYAAGMLLYLAAFHRQMAAHGGLLLILGACSLFALSIAFDAHFSHYFDPDHNAVWLWEDGSKFVGVSLWMAGHFTIALNMVRQAKAGP